MGGAVSSRLEQVARRLTKIGDDIAITAARAVADGITGQLAADGAPLSRYRGGGAPRVEARPTGSNTAEVRPTSGAGQIGILQSGARPHRVGSGTAVLRFQGGGYATGAVNHPGTRPRRSFTNGVERGQGPARTAAADTFSKVFDG